MAAWAFCATEHYPPPLLFGLYRSLKCPSSMPFFSGLSYAARAAVWWRLYLLELEIWAHYVNRCYRQRGGQAWEEEISKCSIGAGEATRKTNGAESQSKQTLKSSLFYNRTVKISQMQWVQRKKKHVSQWSLACSNWNNRSFDKTRSEVNIFLTNISLGTSLNSLRKHILLEALGEKKKKSIQTKFYKTLSIDRTWKKKRISKSVFTLCI